MSNKYVFGKDIIRRFYPTEANEPLNLPTQTPTIYIFDEQPSRSEAIAGTGALSTVSIWAAASVSPFERTYTISALTDPEPTSITANAVYWEAINFVTKTAGQTQTVVRAFTVERVEGSESHPGTKASDLTDIYPALKAYLTTEQLDAHLKLAEDELKIDIEALGLVWSRIKDLNKLKLVLAWKAISLSAESQIKSVEDKFDKRAKLYEDKYNRALKNISVPYDSNGDGLSDSIGVSVKSFYYVDR